MPEELRRRMAELPFRELYEVGGSLRDELLGRAPKDVDFLVRGHDVEELLALCRQYGKADELRVAGRLVGVRFWPSWGPREGIEVVPPRRETPISPGEPGFTGNPHTDFRIEPDPELSVHDDLERRDFTVNAMARDVRTGEWIDPFGGRDDLRAGVLRAVHATAFRDDPLRILRGVVRCSVDGLQPDAGTRELMAEAAPRIAELSAERVREELERTLAGDGAADAMRLARDVGALDSAIPEWAACIGVDQHSATQAYTLDEHILHVLEAAVHEHAAREPRLAAFWHDVGKPLASGERPHAEAGARIVRAALRRLTYDNDTVATVTAPGARALLQRGPRALGARGSRVPGAGRPRARARCARAAPLGSHRPRLPDRARAGRPARALRASSSSRSGISPSRWPTWRCAATTSWRQGWPRDPQSGRRCGACSRRSWTNRR